MQEFTKDRVTRDDLRQIPPGRTAVFHLPTAKALVSARSSACQLARVDPPKGVARFQCESDYDKRTIIIKAIRK